MAKKGGITLSAPVSAASLNGIGACSNRVDNWCDERTALESSPLYTKWENDWNADLSCEAYCRFLCLVSVSRVDWASCECRVNARMRFGVRPD
jgi:hypothetical protein